MTRRSTTFVRRTGRTAAALLAAAALVMTAAPFAGARADPPAWAPAHGYWAKHGHRHHHVHHRLYYQHDDDDDDVYDDDDNDDHDRPRRQRSYAPPAYAVPDVVDVDRCYGDFVGAIIGGATGGLIGAEFGRGHDRTAAIIGGTVIGALIGGSIGHYMDRVDYDCFGRALDRAPDRQPFVWRNPNGVEYNVVPQSTYTDRRGRYCREYNTTAVIGGRTERVYGTACRQPDGSWELVG